MFFHMLFSATIPSVIKNLNNFDEATGSPTYNKNHQFARETKVNFKNAEKSVPRSYNWKKADHMKPSGE